MSLRERLFALETFGIKLGLDNITAILNGLDRPDRAWPAIHVAGTNGKGSVTAMVERGLRASGHRTGRYTSPHLDRIEERVAIDGEPVEPARFDQVTDDAFAVIDRLRRDGALTATPTFFEVTTAIAFEIFRREAVTAAVIEVGLGGRFDATNVLTPAVAAITSIAFDHERHLGSTIGAIAFEKAGIIKPGVPVVVGELPDEARQVIVERARNLRAPVVEADRRFLERVAIERGRATLWVETPADRYANVRLALNGRHQVANAIVAARTLETFAEQGQPLEADAVQTAWSDVVWPARLEWLRQADGGEVLIDAAHNPAGAIALAEYLTEAGVAPLPVVLAVMRDKDVDAIAAAIAPAASSFIATEVDSPRAMPATELASRITARCPAIPVSAVAQPDSAVARTLSGSPRVVVAGSIFLVGPLRARLITRGATHLVEPHRL